MYLTVIMDWYSRHIVVGELSNSLDSDFCLRALDKALGIAAPPKVFHSDQGCQYTARESSGALEGRGTAISMSGRGRAYDNTLVERLRRSLKYEEIHKCEHDTVNGLRRAVEDYIHHYNTGRPHQALDYYRRIRGSTLGAGAPESPCPRPTVHPTTHRPLSNQPQPLQAISPSNGCCSCVSS